MTVNCRFLHSKPQREIASLVRSRLANCRSAEVVSGFATPDGIEALRATSASGRIAQFVLGAGTFKAFQALDDLITAGLAPAAARVHLGHTRATGGKKRPIAEHISSATNPELLKEGNSRARNRRANGAANAWSSMTIDLACCLRAAISCDLHDTRTGIGGEGFGGVAWM
jgi:hypothetical protein